MAAGRWVFPMAVVGLFLFLVAWVAQNPATPLPGTAADRFLRAEPGDVLLVEYTEFYNQSHAYVSYTTREELYTNGTLNASPYGIGFDARPAQLKLPAQITPASKDILGAIVGHRPNETFRTPVYPDLYGAWQDTRTLNRTVGVLNLTFRISNGSSTPDGPFDYNRFVDLWNHVLGHRMRAGDVIACEGNHPWDCNVVTVDNENLTLTYRRAIRDGDRFAAGDLLTFGPGTPVPHNNLTARSVDADHVELQWDLRPGDAFVLPGGPAGWPVGSFFVESVHGGDVTVRYTNAVRYPAHLVGEDVWYEFTIVKVQRE